MNDEQTPDEMPKKKLAQKLITAKRQYFMPEHGLTVEADSIEKALEIVEKQLKRKDGDA